MKREGRKTTEKDKQWGQEEKKRRKERGGEEDDSDGVNG